MTDILKIEEFKDFKKQCREIFSLSDYVDPVTKNSKRSKSSNVIPKKNSNTILCGKLEFLIKIIKDEKIKDISQYLKNSCHINDCDWLNQNALHFASLIGNVEKMKALINCGIKVMSKDNDGDNVLHFAIFGNKEKAVTYLCENFEDLLKEQNKKLETPLLLATKMKLDNIIFKLLEHNSQIINLQDEDGNTVLHYLSANDQTVLFEKVLNYENIQLNILNSDEYSPFHFACRAKKSKIINQFINYCTRNNDFFPINQLTSNHASGAQILILKKKYNLAKHLIIIQPRKWSKDPINLKNGTILHSAVEEINLELVKCIIDTDSNIVDIKNKNGKTALDIALEIYDNHLENQYMESQDIAIYLFINQAKIILQKNESILYKIVGEYSSGLKHIVSQDLCIYYTKIYHVLENDYKSFKDNLSYNSSKEIIFEHLVDYLDIYDKKIKGDIVEILKETKNINDHVKIALNCFCVSINLINVLMDDLNDNPAVISKLFNYLTDLTETVEKINVIGRRMTEIILYCLCNYCNSCYINKVPLCRPQDKYIIALKSCFDNNQKSSKMKVSSGIILCFYSSKTNISTISIREYLEKIYENIKSPNQYFGIKGYLIDLAIKMSLSSL